MALSEEQVDVQKIELIKKTASDICNTVKEARGRKTETQTQAEVQAKISGLFAKVLDIGGNVKAQRGEEEYEGLSRDATALGLQGDRECRERLFNKMFDKLGSVSAGTRNDIGIATLTYWNDSKFIMSRCDAKLVAADEYSTSASDNMQTLSTGLADCAERVRALPIRNVDEELVNAIGELSNLMVNASSLLVEAATIARQEENYQRTYHMLPPDHLQKLQYINQKKEAMTTRGSPMDRLNGLRGKLGRRYGLEFGPFS